jgi:hypothetical protein
MPRLATRCSSPPGRMLLTSNRVWLRLRIDFRVDQPELYEAGIIKYTLIDILLPLDLL